MHIREVGRRSLAVGRGKRWQGQRPSDANQNLSNRSTCAHRGDNYALGTNYNRLCLQLVPFSGLGLKFPTISANTSRRSAWMMMILASLTAYTPLNRLICMNRASENRPINRRCQPRKVYKIMQNRRPLL